MNDSLIHIFTAAMASHIVKPTEKATAFSQMSQEAQDLVVDAFLGEFDETGPPEIPEHVRDELAQWLLSDNPL